MRGNGTPGNGHYIRGSKAAQATPVFTHILAIVLATLGNLLLFSVPFESSADFEGCHA